MALFSECPACFCGAWTFGLGRAGSVHSKECSTDCSWGVNKHDHEYLALKSGVDEGVTRLAPAGLCESGRSRPLCGRTPQETVADELEEGYRREIWSPAKGRVKEQKQGVAAARVDLRTLVNEAKVRARVSWGWRVDGFQTPILPLPFMCLICAPFQHSLLLLTMCALLKGHGCHKGPCWSTISLSAGWCYTCWGVCACRACTRCL